MASLEKIMLTSVTITEQYSKDWYVVLTKSKQELRAQDNLERQGGVVFVPMFTKERITRGKRVVRQEPLFPGYLFLQADAQSDANY